MACGVLNIFDKKTDDLINDELLLHKIPYFDLNCLDLAARAKCLNFISLPACQKVLTDIWNGNVENVSGINGSICVIMPKI